MATRSMGGKPPMSRSVRFLAVAAAAMLALGGGFAWLMHAEAASRFDPSIRAEFREPVTLATKDGVLEVRLTARQGEVKLDTVEKPVKNFMLFDYELIRGTASDGKTSGKALYPAPTLQVFPGETLIVHLDNKLSGLTIRDYYNPAYTPKGTPVPPYPEMLTESPMNLHVHGVHVSPKGNADNVMLHIPGNMSNTFRYDIPKNMPQGVYWYHSHLHTLTSLQTYFGLAGMLAIGRTDGNLPVVTDKKIPIRNMMLQYNFVSNRADGMNMINNPNWSQFIATPTRPVTLDELAKGTFRPLLTPTNFTKSKPGSKFATVWYSGDSKEKNERGLTMFMPSNMVSFFPNDGKPENTLLADPALPDYKRDVQFTVNGQFQPVIKSKAGQTEIWVLANVSDIAYMYVQLTETATGRHPPFAIVGQDGNPYTEVAYPPTFDGTRLLIPPASRFAIAVTIPEKGELVLEIPDRGPGAKAVARTAIMYTSNGTENPSAVLGGINVLPETISYNDGFFIYPTQKLATAVPSQGKGETVPFPAGQKLNTYTSFVELSKTKPDHTRNILINGGFLNDMTTRDEPKAFIYAFDSKAFPSTPLIQPRLDSVEEWKFVNHNNDEHPIHIHVNDFQVVEYYDPTIGLRTGPDKFGVDNANVAAPSILSDETVVEAAHMNVRMRFDDYIGIFVMHCHRLNHEDNGLMMMVSVIPAVSSYAVVVPGGGGKATEVRAYDGNGDKQLASVTPFPGYEGNVSVVMGDVNGDGVHDLVVGAGKGQAPVVAAFSGKDGFKKELVRFQAFPDDMKGGINVAAAQIDGTSADNIIVASGPGSASMVKVYGTALPSETGKAPPVFSGFKPYGDDKSGVTLTTGFVDFGTGRYSIVTAPGPGAVAEVKVFVYPLYTVAKGAKAPPGSHGHEKGPEMSASFKPFGDGYKDGVSLATGFLAGVLGGAERIAVGQLAGAGAVSVWSGATALDGGPAMYLQNPSKHNAPTFREIANFKPFDGGARVAATSTTEGANLVVSGVSGGQSKVQKFAFEQSKSQPKMLEAKRIGEIATLSGTQAATLGGD
ncbi:MAG: multicopper oxidase domain-containing protein [Alphaproteobacteria bacterium]